MSEGMTLDFLPSRPLESVTFQPPFRGKLPPPLKLIELVTT